MYTILSKTLVMKRTSRRVVVVALAETRATRATKPCGVCSKLVSRRRLLAPTATTALKRNRRFCKRAQFSVSTQYLTCPRRRSSITRNNLPPSQSWPDIGTQARLKKIKSDSWRTRLTWTTQVSLIQLLWYLLRREAAPRMRSLRCLS